MTRARLWVRRLLRGSGPRVVLCWAMHLYIRFVYATNRWVIEGEEWPRRLRGDGRAFIGTFWHGRMMMMPMSWRRLAPMHMLISAHRDGQIIAETIAYFGVQSISGSTQRGGSAALRRMLRRLDAGECVCVTPDGPRGPAMTVSRGIVNLARLAGAPIIPIVCATSNRKVLNSWDRFNFALPFGRGVFLVGEPIEIASDLDAAGIEDARLLLETRMNEMTREADRRVGHCTTMHSPDQFRLAHDDEPTAGAPRRGSRPAPDDSTLSAQEPLSAGKGQRP